MLILLVLSILFVLPVSSLHAQEDPLLQEMGLQVVGSSSDNQEFPSPRGFELSSRWEFGDRWLFQLSFHRVTDESSKQGVVCKQYAPHIECVEAETHSEVALAGLRGGLQRTVELGEFLRLGVGVGLSFNGVRADNVGEDGRKADLLAPKTGLVGYLGLISADLALGRRLPLHLTGGYTAHWVHFHTCSGFNPPQYDPFCEIARFDEVALGLALRF